MCNNLNLITSKLFLYKLYNKEGIIRKVLFCIIQWCPYFENGKMAINPFCDKSLHI